MCAATALLLQRPAGGPLAGGALVEWAGWEAIFWLNLPATLLLLAVTRRTIAEPRDPAAGPPDLAGLATFLVAAICAFAAVPAALLLVHRA